MNYGATSKRNATTGSKLHIDCRFQSFHVLACEHPIFLSVVSLSKKESWTSGIDTMAGDVAPVFKEPTIESGGGGLAVKTNEIMDGDWMPPDADHISTNTTELFLFRNTQPLTFRITLLTTM